MIQIYIEKSFAIAQRVQTEVNGVLPHTLGCLTEGLWKDAEERARKQGRKLEDKARYFYDRTTDGGIICLLRGSYSQFVAANFLSTLLEEQGHTQTAEDLFRDPSIRALGLHALLTTSDDHIILGRRSDKVYQAREYLDFPSGGVMPEYYELTEGKPDLYVAAQRQIQDEIGVELKKEDLNLLGIVRDSKTVKSFSLVFTSTIPQTSKEVKKAFQGAKDNYEHAKLEVVPEENLHQILFEGLPKVVGASLGALFLRAKKKEREDFCEELRNNLLESDYEVVEV